MTETDVSGDQHFMFVRHTGFIQVRRRWECSSISVDGTSTKPSHQPLLRDQLLALPANVLMMQVMPSMCNVLLCLVITGRCATRRHRRSLRRGWLSAPAA